MGLIIREIDSADRSLGKFYIATCDQFDDSHTGWHTSEADAVAAFWSENRYTEREAAFILVYTDELRDPTDSEVAEEAAWAEENGRESAARWITARPEP